MGSDDQQENQMDTDVVQVTSLPLEEISEMNSVASLSWTQIFGLRKIKIPPQTLTFSLSKLPTIKN